MLCFSDNPSLNLCHNTVVVVLWSMQEGTTENSQKQPEAWLGKAPNHQKAKETVNQDTKGCTDVTLYLGNNYQDVAKNH